MARHAAPEQRRSYQLEVSQVDGCLQDPESLKLIQTVIADKYGIFPGDVEQTVYFKVRKIESVVRETTATLTMPMSEKPTAMEQAQTSSTTKRTANTSKYELSISARVVKYGCYPLLPAGRRNWTNQHVDIELGTDNFTWPPEGWQDLSPEHRLWAVKTVITLREMKKSGGLFPDGDVAEYIDMYKCLILPYTQKIRREGLSEVRKVQDIRDIA